MAMKPEQYRRAGDEARRLGDRIRIFGSTKHPDKRSQKSLSRAIADLETHAKKLSADHRATQE